MVVRDSGGEAPSTPREKTRTDEVRDAAEESGLLGVRHGKDEQDDGYPCGIDDEERHDYLRCFPSTRDSPHSTSTIVRIPTYTIRSESIGVGTQQQRGIIRACCFCAYRQSIPQPTA